MAILTLAPSRTYGVFAKGSYAYAYADHGVRKDGALITPVALTDMAIEDGDLSFDLVPSDNADDCEQFTYTVAAFDPNGRRMYIVNIIMPDTDVSIWSLIPKTVDPDLRGALAVVVAEPEPDVYCGIEPVDPGELNNGIPDTPVVPLIDGIYNNDFIDVFNLVANDEAFEAISGDIESTQYTFVGGDVVDVLLPDYTPGEGSAVSILGRVHRSESSSGPILSLFEVDTTTQIQLDDERVQPGRVIRIRRRTDDNAFELVDSYVEGPSITQADIDAYNAAKATYDQCIADGGIPGNDPSIATYCGVEPVEPVGDEQQITELVTTNATGASLSNDNLTVTSHDNYGQAVTTAESSKTDGIFYWETVYGVGGSGVGVRPDGKNEAYVGSTANSYGVWKDESWYVQGTNISGHGPYPMGGVIRHLLEVSPTGEGSYRIADGENDFELVGVLPSGLSWQAASSGYASAEVSFRFYEDQFTYDIPNGAVAYGVSLFDDPDQAQVDAYTAAKATYDQCIADGGIPGEQP